jgi:peptidoglycan hydrolase-like protein with peptidoglycan-binding domain
VAWVRRALDRIEGENPAAAVPDADDIYDENLKQRVERFQKARSLTADGRVGIETLVQLAAAVAEPQAPWIGRESR